MKPYLTSHDFTYNYRPAQMLTRAQKVKRFFVRRKPPFWAVFATCILIAAYALAQRDDARADRSMREITMACGRAA
jgi:hypothetical protein